VRRILATPTGFSFIFDMKDKTWKAQCLFGTPTQKQVWRFDEIWLATKDLTRARASWKPPFKGEWWVESVTEVRSRVMTDADKKRLRKHMADIDAGRIDPQVRGQKRRGFSFPKLKIKKTAAA
jgi:hypothetical protein